MNTLQNNLHTIQNQIQTASQTYQRRNVHLLAVSKRHSASAIRQLYALGQHHFGESYLQEALIKIAQLNDLDCHWHFIGPIQSNKTQQIAQHFAWVHSVDRLKIAQRLSQQRPTDLPPLNICLQVNISQEASKSGLSPEELPELAKAVSKLANLRLRGLMAIPAPQKEFARQRAEFRKLAQIQQQLIQQGHPLDTLSMGMSNDLKAAIAEGSTLVRIGTALFGQRQN
ncbi:MAG: YggS family pyridoxal phosphate-dependent enzyme [Gammaproteobacteria bacterium]|nr:YggS family pyridoxal phosphate-dependent enzyme [Gammaproteobacteria bacterium]